MQVCWKIQFLRGFIKKQYIGGIVEKGGEGGGSWTIFRFKRGLDKKEGWGCFWVGLIAQCTLWREVFLKLLKLTKTQGTFFSDLYSAWSYFAISINSVLISLTSCSLYLVSLSISINSVLISLTSCSLYLESLLILKMKPSLNVAQESIPLLLFEDDS